MASEHVIAVDESNFQEVVLESREPVLVDFWAEWCGPCKMLSPIIDEVAKENVGKVKICKLNIDEHQAVATQWKVMSIPTLLVFNGGNMVGQHIGAISKDDLKAFIKSSLNS